MSKAEKSVMRKGPNMMDKKLNQLSDALTRLQSVGSSFDGDAVGSDIPSILRYSNS